MSLLDLIFGCSHEHITWPQTVKRRRENPTYIVCLTCGKEFGYDFEAMRIVKEVKKAPERIEACTQIEIYTK